MYYGKFQFLKFNERAIDNCTPLSSNADNFIQ